MITGYIAKNGKGFFGDDFVEYQDASYGLPKPILEVLSPLKYELYFYGSRSKMPIPVEDKVSDWDFAVDSSKHPILPQIFKYNQSEQETYTSYVDGFTFECYEADIDGYKVQIALKSQFEWFKSVWDNLDEDFYKTYINKRSPQYMSKEGVTQLFRSYSTLYDKYLNKSYEDML